MLGHVNIFLQSVLALDNCKLCAENGYKPPVVLEGEKELFRHPGPMHP